MKIPLDWLQEYIETDLTPEQIGETLTTTGLEMEGIHNSVMEIALTPNLVHCASIRGIARELGSAIDKKCKSPKVFVSESDESIEKLTSVQVENPEACPRYACRVITNVRVTPSPDWLKTRIEACGMRRVNNVVDITNFVLLELGHPLHAFDLDQLTEKRIVVRSAKKGEKIVTLDGKEHFPSQETLLICDAQKPVAVAGIMGSLETEVSEKTTTILLESAYFEPNHIRRAAKHLGIRSEASYRFERGTDPNGVLEALDLATTMICSLAGGVALKGVLDVKAKNFEPLTISCRISRVNQLLGTQLGMSEVETILSRLHFEVVNTKGDVITVKAPTYRHDMKEEIDLVEEVARLYGYDNIKKKERAFFRTGNLKNSPEYLFSRKVRCRLISEGLQEFMTCDLISPLQASLISTDNIPSRTLIHLLNPHSTEQSVMRPSLLPGMLSVLKVNADHDIHTVAGFEIGRVHFTAKEHFYEPPVASIILSGDRAPGQFETKNEKVDFFDLKGIVENLFASLKIENFSFSPSKFENFHPGRQAEIIIHNVRVGIMGEVHPSTLKKADLNQPAFFAELNLHDLYSHLPEAIQIKPLPQYPASSRDWTVTVPDQISVGQLTGWIQQIPSDLLESFSLLDVYRSDKLGSDRKNVTFRFVYRDKHTTVSLATVENEHLRITKAILEHIT